MDRSPHYYSSSLLSTYLSEPESATQGQEPVPQIHVSEPIHSEDNQETVTKIDNKNASLESPFSAMSLGTQGSRMSTVSTSASTVFTSRSSISEISDDFDLQSVRMTLEKFDSVNSHGNKFKKFKSKLLGEEKAPEPSSEEDQFFAYVIGKLKAQHYHNEKNTTLNVTWDDAAEVFFFGDTIENLFTNDTHLLNYLTESAYELGEVRFSNLSKYHSDRDYDIAGLLEDLQPRLLKFNGVLDLYAESDTNIKSPELYEIFSTQANHYDGLCVPLAIAMFGNWLLSYNKDKALTSNYDNTLILDYFRKAARLALVLRKAKSLLCSNATGLDKTSSINLNRYWGKDNQNALSTSLHALGEYYQFLHNYDVAVTLWELNCHLTGDAESGHLAILGLTDGFGIGNHCKEHNRFGKRSKTNKFNTKRRIAHLYRILMKQPNFDEYGVSWATKEKYD